MPDHDPETQGNTAVVEGVVSVQLADAGSFTDQVISAWFIAMDPFRVKVSTGGVVSPAI